MKQTDSINRNKLKTEDSINRNKQIELMKHDRFN